jgi:hypothetical protein
MDQKGGQGMTVADLNQIETDEAVKFKLLPDRRFVIKGKPSASDRALARIADCRNEIPDLLIERDGDGEVVTERIIPTGVPSLEIQRERYIAWYSGRSGYYQPSPEQLDRMMAACEEGDLLIFDFALSFTVIKPNGRIVGVNRKGEIVPPSPYSPAMQQGK